MIARLKKLQVALFATFLLFGLTSCAPMLAMDEDWQSYVPHAGQSILDMLNRQDVVEISITANFDSLINNRNTEEYLPAGFTYQDGKGVAHAYQVKIKPRGKFRRRVCDFPPLKIKLSKDELQAAGLSNMNELKLVTHCLDDKLEGNEQVLREYLVYKMYNELTPMSFRVQLAKVTYRDSSGKGKKTTRWGILIEDEEELQARKGATLCDCMGQQKDAMQPTHERMASLFQYMIGNSDWSLEMLRNVKLFRTGEDKLIPVPYDFDFSALVSAPYARPNADFAQKNIRERVFMGLATSAEELYATVSYFKSKKEALYKIVRNFKYLNEEARQDMIEYLESFYLLAGDMQRLQVEMFEKNRASVQEVAR